MWHLIVLLLAACGAVYGFRRGLARQTPSLVAMAFGLISARLLAPALIDTLYGAFPSVHGHPEQNFVYDTLASTFVFCSIYLIFRVCTGFLGKVLDAGEKTILNNLGGALYGLFKYLLFTSIALNMLVALKLNDSLIRCARSDDGNAVEEVMLLGPALMGGEDVEDLAHRLQLEEAKKIS